MDNEPQPDAMLFVEPARGGQVKISEDDYIEGAPELVADVASSSVSFDLHTKFNVYRRCGVKEYVVWRVIDRAVDWFVLVRGTYERLAPEADGLFKSRVFPGLWLDTEALLGGDLAQVLSSVQKGLASPEHEEFVQRLARGGGG
jgi:Uma2 family endonuclease